MGNLIAQAVGAGALLLNVGSNQLKNSRLLILCRAAGDFIYMIHYLLLGAYSGCTTVTICAVNGLICSFRGSPWADWKGWKWLISVVLVIACLLTWRASFQPIPCLCSLLSILTTIWVTWSGSGKVIRLGRLFVAGPAWLIYCISVGSVPGALAEIVGMGSVVISILRYGIKNLDQPI